MTEIPKWTGSREPYVLAAGSGSFFVSLTGALQASGWKKYGVLETGGEKTEMSWRESVRPYDAVLYVSQEGGEFGNLRRLLSACGQEGKWLFPAVILEQSGLTGPPVRPYDGGSWESALRRVHLSAVRKAPQQPLFPDAAEALLANALVFDFLQMTEDAGRETAYDPGRSFLLMDLNTLEAGRHSFLPHPIVTGLADAEEILDFESRLEPDGSRKDPDPPIPDFGRWTSSVTGIFHSWEEGDLIQLPLAQCRVQASDPLSPGPAGLLPDLVRSGLTHAEARLETGLAGIEVYIARLAGPTVWAPAACGNTAVGAGRTFAEGVSRALHRCLQDECDRRQADRTPAIRQVRLTEVEDERSRFYLRALEWMCGEVPDLGEDQEIRGFPVMWAGTGGNWYGSVGFSRTGALRNALQLAVTQAQNQTVGNSLNGLECGDVPIQEKEPLQLAISGEDDPWGDPKVLRSALQVLARNRTRLRIWDLTLEPFIREELAGVFGVQLQEVTSS